MPNECEACGEQRGDDPDFCDECLAEMKTKRAEIEPAGFPPRPGFLDDHLNAINNRKHR